MPEANTTVIPHLICRDAAEAAEFYQKAFGAEVPCILRTPDGKVMHAAITIAGASIYLCDEFPEQGALGPLSLGGSPVTLHLQVPDCDALFQRAVDAGCQVRMPLQEVFWGDRYGQLSDPYGHLWSIATTVRQVNTEELPQAISAACSG